MGTLPDAPKPHQNCNPEVACPCAHLGPSCAGCAVAETPTHRAVINKELNKVWVPLPGYRPAP